MKLENIILLNTTKFKDKTMTMEDSKGFINIKAKENELPTNFYGNRIANLAKTIYPGVYLCVDKYSTPFDILALRDEIVELDPSEIRAILVAKNIPHAKQMPKKQLLSLLGVDYNKPEEVQEPDGQAPTQTDIPPATDRADANK